MNQLANLAVVLRSQQRAEAVSALNAKFGINGDLTNLDVLRLGQQTARLTDIPLSQPILMSPQCAALSDQSRHPRLRGGTLSRMALAADKGEDPSVYLRSSQSRTLHHTSLLVCPEKMPL